MAGILVNNMVLSSTSAIADVACNMRDTASSQCSNRNVLHNSLEALTSSPMIYTNEHV